MKAEFKNKLFNKNSRNKGSTLITVIVVVAFMSILATILIYVVGENYKTKVYDIKNKESFYEAEIISERLKANLIKDVVKASKPAYDAVVMDFSQSENEEVRATDYFTNFQDEFIDIWGEHWTHVIGGSPSNELNYKSLFGNDIVYSDSSPDQFELEINGHHLTCTFEFDHDLYRSDLTTKITSTNMAPIFTDGGDVASYYIKGVKLTVQDTDTNYISIIETSFQITPPQLNWGDTERNHDETLDYSKCVKYYKYVKK